MSTVAEESTFRTIRSRSLTKTASESTTPDIQVSTSMITHNFGQSTVFSRIDKTTVRKESISDHNNPQNDIDIHSFSTPAFELKILDASILAKSGSQSSFASCDALETKSEIPKYNPVYQEPSVQQMDISIHHTSSHCPSLSKTVDINNDFKDEVSVDSELEHLCLGQACSRLFCCC